MDRKIDTTVYIQLYIIRNNRWKTPPSPTLCTRLKRLVHHDQLFFLQKASCFCSVFFNTDYIHHKYVHATETALLQNSEKVVRITFPGGHRSLLKRWLLVFFFLLFFFFFVAGAELCGLDLLRSGKKKNISKRAEKSFWFALVSVVCWHWLLLLLFCRRCVRDTRQTRTCWGQGEAPFEAGLSNLSNPILSRKLP